MPLAEQLISTGYSKGREEAMSQFSKFLESYMSGKDRDKAAAEAGFDLEEPHIQDFLSKLPVVSQFPSPPAP